MCFLLNCNCRLTSFTAAATAMLIVALLRPSWSAEIVVLHDFEGIYSDDGGRGYGGLSLGSDQVIYGTSPSGGSAAYNGTVFQLMPSGADYEVILDLPGPSENLGTFPKDAPKVIGSTLYVTTSEGGASNAGAIFSANTDGSNPVLMQTMGGANGGNPYPKLTAVGATLYGTAYSGGANSQGTLFSVATTAIGSEDNLYAFTVLHSFAGNEGSGPQSELISDGETTLFGTTSAGGSSGGGTLFQFDTTSGVEVLHSFGGTSGASPTGTMNLIDGVLYGTTVLGGAYGLGTVFSFDTLTDNFMVLYSFGGTPQDGIKPSGSLETDGTFLYGTTYAGGEFASAEYQGDGTVFRIRYDGTDYETIGHFDSRDTGSQPEGDLVLFNGQLFGITNSNGTYGLGTIWTIAIPEPGLTALVGFVALLLGLVFNRRRRADSRVAS